MFPFWEQVYPRQVTQCEPRARVRCSCETRRWMLPRLFDRRNGFDDHPQFRVCRDGFTRERERRALARIWKKYGHLHPEKPQQFIPEFRKNFPARAWELTCSRFSLDTARLGRSCRRDRIFASLSVMASGAGSNAWFRHQDRGAMQFEEEFPARASIHSAPQRPSFSVTQRRLPAR